MVKLPSPSKSINAFKEMVETDTTTRRVKSFIVQNSPKLPAATGRYLLDRVPIVSWLPHYHPEWIITDTIAGLTIGVMLIPQGLAYAKIATIPIQNGLYSCWVPAAIAVFMGTSKELSSGPTSILGLLTAQIVADLVTEYDAASIASAVAFMVGVYCLALGLFGLGFLLEFVSVPVLTGFISATALTIAFGQVGALVGVSGAPSTVFEIIGYVLRRVPQWNGPTCAIGIGTIVILLALEKVGKKWGKKHIIIKYLASSRAVIVLILFTLISWLVNRNRKELLWDIAKVSTNGIGTPKASDTALIGKVAVRAIAPLLAAALEHLAVGKAFGRRNGYAIDQTQELNYLGVTNIVNSFFGAMPVSGAMSRTAVNSECGVRTPLSGLVTAGVILLTLYVLSPALYWLPKSTLAAIIIMAVIHLFGPVSHFYRFWRISLADFVASMIAFWLTIFVSAEMGIEIAAGWSVVWTLLRSAFVGPRIKTGSNDDDGDNAALPFNNSSNSQTEHAGLTIPDSTVVIHFRDSIFYPNAGRGKRLAFEAIQLVYAKAGAQLGARDKERSWSVAAQKRVERLRRERAIVMKETPLAVVVWDFAAVPFIDVTGILALGELKMDIRGHAGQDVQFRLVGLSASVRERFERTKWALVDLYGDGGGGGDRDEEADVVYPSLERAVLDGRRGSALEEVVVMGSEKMG